MRISDWSSDVCSSDLPVDHPGRRIAKQWIEVRQGPCGQEIARCDLLRGILYPYRMHRTPRSGFCQRHAQEGCLLVVAFDQMNPAANFRLQNGGDDPRKATARTEIDPYRRRRIEPEQLRAVRSEEHTSELQSLMRISYAVFCLKKKTNQT